MRNIGVRAGFPVWQEDDVLIIKAALGSNDNAMGGRLTGTVDFIL